MLINFSKAEAEAANLKLEILFLRLESAGAAACGAPIAFPRKSDPTAPPGGLEKWNRGLGTLAIQASSEECRGHPRDCSFWK